MEIKKSLENRLNIKPYNTEDLNEKVKLANEQKTNEEFLLDNKIYLENIKNKKSYNFTAIEWIQTWRVIE
tara:strand:+ start:9 stop:218 length:210 start_codon:yes stop_codon:yes gene_type:complete